MHPGHKNLSWLPARDKREAIEQFVDELMNVADADTTNIGGIFRGKHYDYCAYNSSGFIL